MFYLGSAEVRLRVRESRSLKDKRQVVRSITDRLRDSFRVAVEEVGARDQWQLVVLGIATVGEDYAGVKQRLDQIVQALRGHPIAEYLGSSIAVGRTDQQSPADRMGDRPGDGPGATPDTDEFDPDEFDR